MGIWSRVWKLVKQIAVGSACVLAVALIAGTLYQWIATRRDEQRYPPPGQLVDIGDHRLHINCTGQGSPTVILEAGLGGGSLDWDLVQHGVASFARVCSYDRSGVGWSERGTTEPDAANIVDELHRLLAADNVAPPYMLVGHSIGGVYAQLFASKYRDEVAGVVLVDSSSQDQIERIGGIPFFVPYLMKTAAPIGLARVIGQMITPPPELSTEANERRNAVYLRSRHIFAAADEMRNIPAGLNELRGAPMDLGDKPLVVLQRGLSDGFSPQVAATWDELQADLAKRSLNSHRIVAQHSGHYIHFSEPELVVDAIRKAAGK